MSLPLPSPPTAEDALRYTRQWVERAVIGLNLCPFAKAVMVRERVRFRAIGETHPDAVLAALEEELHLLEATPEDSIETSLLVLTQAFPDFLEFHFFQQEVTALLQRLELSGVFQVAPFHPRWEFAGSPATDVGNCVGRAPLPTLHLLRETSIDRAVAAFPDAARIYEANRRTLQALGWEGWRRVMAASGDAID